MAWVSIFDHPFIQRSRTPARMDRWESATWSGTPTGSKTLVLMSLPISATTRAAGERIRSGYQPSMVRSRGCLPKVGKERRGLWSRNGSACQRRRRPNSREHGRPTRVPKCVKPGSSSLRGTGYPRLSKLADRLALGTTVQMLRIGCGLAGGQWEKVEPLIESRLVDGGYDVRVYDFPVGA